MSESGILYILKFVPAFHHAKYYVGWCYPGGLYKRLQAHRTGRGAHITRAAIEQGHRLELIWDHPGTREDERRIKKQKNTPEFVDRLRDRGMLNSQKHQYSTKNQAGSRRTNQHYDHESEDKHMSIDQSHINIVQLIEQTVKLKRQGHEHYGPCPECGGTDRLFVIEKTGRWACRQCNIKGDAVNWVMRRDRVSFVEACATLGISLQALPHASRTPRQPLVRKNQPADSTTLSKQRESAALDDPEWRKAATRFAIGANEWLFLHAPEKLAYLKARGFTEQTLINAWIGYNPASRKQMWGDTEVWLPQGIVIPWWFGGSADGIMRVNIRQDNPGEGPKYIQAKGGANWLYNGNALNADSTAILLEGEFDALTIRQALPQPQYVGVATGSASGARLIKWIARLAQCRRVLIPADNDRAGNEAAAKWRMLLPENSRIIAVPQGKDVNEFYQAVFNMSSSAAPHNYASMQIRAWIESVTL